VDFPALRAVFFFRAPFLRAFFRAAIPFPSHSPPMGAVQAILRTRAKRGQRKPAPRRPRGRFGPANRASFPPCRSR
jgi:hypothetical protein